MKKLICILLALMLVCFSGAALAAGKLTVSQETFIVLPYSSYFAGYVYAEVTNSGDKTVAFNGGLLELFDANGDALDSTNLYYCFPEVLEPGETGYLYAYQSADEAKAAEDIADYSLTVTGKSEKDTVTLRLDATGVFGEVQKSKYWSDYQLTALITNNTENTQREIYVVYALKDAEGKLLYADSTTLYNIGLPAGQSLEATVTIYGDLLDKWAADGTTPATIDVIAYTEIKE